jgi:hypothetical protein
MVVRFGHEGFLVRERFTPRSSGQLGLRSAQLLRVAKHRSAAPGRGALSGAHWGTAPRELPFEGGDPIAKRCVLGFLIAQSLGKVEGNERE